MVQNGIRTSQITGDLTFPRRLNSAEPGWCGEASKHQLRISNDLTIGWQNLNPLSHPNTTLAPQARQARLSGEIITESLVWHPKYDHWVLLCFQIRWWFVVSDWVWELWNSSSPQQRRKSLELRLYSICDWWWGQGLPGNQRMKEGEAPSLQSLLDWGIITEWCAGERSMIWCLAGAIQEFIVLLSLMR